MVVLIFGGWILIDSNKNKDRRQIVYRVSWRKNVNGNVERDLCSNSYRLLSRIFTSSVNGTASWWNSIYFGVIVSMVSKVHGLLHSWCGLFRSCEYSKERWKIGMSGIPFGTDSFFEFSSWVREKFILHYIVYFYTFNICCVLLKQLYISKVI